MRGEYPLVVFANQVISELPPRARRIPPAYRLHGSFIGTTSACAENTAGDTSDNSNKRNYLRVRGEYGEIRLRDIENLELPPRARRILGNLIFQCSYCGTTSACAENTPNQ